MGAGRLSGRREPGLGGPGSNDRIQRIGLALPAPVLPVGTVHLHHPDTAGCHVTGQAGAVAAGAFDPDQASGPEPVGASSRASASLFAMQHGLLSGEHLAPA
jgi:hypothetical protein